MSEMSERLLRMGQLQDKLNEAYRDIDRLARQSEDWNGKHQLAVTEIDKLVDVLERNGFHRCDIPACNCGSWHLTK